MKKCLAVMIALTYMVLNTNAEATPKFDYNYFDLSYVYVSPDTQDIDSGKGVNTLISWSPVDGFFLEGGYEYVNFDAGKIDIDENSFRYGGGIYAPFASDMQLVGRVGGISVNTDVNGFGGFEIEEESDSTTGVYAGAALRYKYSEGIELEPSIEYSHVDTGTWVYELKGLVEILVNLELTGSVAISEETDVELTGGLRYSWG